MICVYAVDLELYEYVKSVTIYSGYIPVIVVNNYYGGHAISYIVIVLYWKGSNVLIYIQ